MAAQKLNDSTVDGERQVVREKCLAQEHKIISPDHSIQRQVH